MPPPLLYVENLATTDSNILAPAAYTFTLNATTTFPSTTDGNQYELLFKLPLVSYPDYNQTQVIRYSFLGNTSLQTMSSAFNFRNFIFFDANYPDLASLGPFNLALLNMSNPETMSYCGLNAAGLPVTFNIQYVSRSQGYVYGRNYLIMDQQNCLPLGKNREAITVIAPIYLRRGLTHEITLQTQELASNLYLSPLAPFLIFQPATVGFMNYQTSTVTVQVIVPSNIPLGNYQIKWRKQETGNYTSYLEVEPTQVIVVAEGVSQSVTPMPTVVVEPVQYVWTGKAPRDVLITLDSEPAEQLIVTINTRTYDFNLEGSVDGIVYSRFPISVIFLRGVKTQKFYIFADNDAVNNVLKYSISGVNVAAYNPAIAESPFTVKINSANDNFQILTINQLQTLQNEVDFLVALSGAGRIYYMAIVASSLSPTTDQIVSGQLTGVGSQFYNAGSLDVMKYTSGYTFSEFVNITNLQAQTSYTVFFVGRSTYGDYSNISTVNLTTVRVTEGVNLLIPTLKSTSVLNLIEALSVVLPIEESRLIFRGVELFPPQYISQKDQVIGNQLNGYTITVAPDSDDNSPTPAQIANALTDPQKISDLLALVPELYTNIPIRVTPVERSAPRVITAPSIASVSYYTVNVNIELIEVGKVYAIATLRNQTQPTSYQISNGLLANNQQLDERFYKVVGTNRNGNGLVVFDELNDFSEYNIYITAGNDIPYDPVDLLTDSNVMMLQVKTLKNPNVGSSDDSLALYSQYFDKSAEIARGTIWSVIVMVMLVVVNNM